MIGPAPPLRGRPSPLAGLGAPWGGGSSMTLRVSVSLALTSVPRCRHWQSHTSFTLFLRNMHLMARPTSSWNLPWPNLDLFGWGSFLSPRREWLPHAPFLPRPESLPSSGHICGPPERPGGITHLKSCHLRVQLRHGLWWCSVCFLRGLWPRHAFLPWQRDVGW